MAIAGTSILPWRSLSEMHAADPPSSPARTRLRRAWIGIALAGLGLGAAAAWLLTTASGLAASLALAGWLSGGQLEISSVRGQLLGPLAVDALRWHRQGETGSDAIQLAGLELAWQPAALLRGRLVIDRLHARELRLERAPSPATPPPARLTFPFAGQVDALTLDHLYLDGPTPADSPALTQLTARLTSDGQTHRLTHLSFRHAALTIQAEAELGGIQPLPVTARIELEGKLAAQPLRLSLTADGPLAALAVRGDIHGAESQGELTATLTPFARQPFSRLQARLRHIDPSLWHAAAPAAGLDLDAELRPGPGSDLVGHLRLINRHSAPLDRNALPLASLDAAVHWHDHLAGVIAL